MSEITRNQAIQIVEDIRTAISAGSVTNTMEAQVLEYCVSVLGRRIVETGQSGYIENLPDIVAFLAGFSSPTTLRVLLNAITEKIPAEASRDNKLADKAFVTELANALQNAVDTINGKIPAEASSSNQMADKAFVTALTTALQNAVDTINANIGNGYVYAGIATPASTPVNGKVFYLARQAGHYTNFGGLTVTEGINILKRNGSTWTQEQLVSMADIYKNPLIGYYECDTAGNTAAKAVTAAGYVLPATGGSMKIKMANRNTAANATLNINSTGAKPLYYNGQRAGVGNTWDTNEIIEVFYDGAKYQAYNVAGCNGDGVFDISAYNLTDGQPTPYEDLAAALGPNGDNVPLSLRKGGMRIKFVHDDKYVQFRYMLEYQNTTAGNNAFLDTTNWQGVDDEPTDGSQNLVKSGGTVIALAESQGFAVPLLKRIALKNYLRPTAGTFNVGDTSNHYIIKINPGDVVSLTKGTNTCVYCFLKSYQQTYLNLAPDLCEGTSIYQLGTENPEIEVTAPSDVKYMYLTGAVGGVNRKPSKFTINEYDLISGLPVTDEIKDQSNHLSKSTDIYRFVTENQSYMISLSKRIKMNGWLRTTGTFNLADECYHVVIKVNPGDSVYFKRKSGSNSTIAFVKSYSQVVADGSPDFCNGTSVYNANEDTPSLNLVAPSDAKYVIVGMSTVGVDHAPSKFTINEYDLISGTQIIPVEVSDDMKHTISKASEYLQNAEYVGNCYIKDDGTLSDSGSWKIYKFRISEGKKYNISTYIRQVTNNQTAKRSFVVLTQDITSRTYDISIVHAVGEIYGGSTETGGTGTTFNPSYVNETYESDIDGFLLVCFGVDPGTNHTVENTVSVVCSDSDIVNIKNNGLLTINDLSPYLTNELVYSSVKLVISKTSAFLPFIMNWVVKAIPNNNGEYPYIYYNIPSIHTNCYYYIKNQEYDNKQYRFPVVPQGNYAFLNIVIPSGASLYVKDFLLRKEEYPLRQNNVGIRLSSHLGICGPSNTLQAFENAIRSGFNYVIANVIASADGTLYCYHDGAATLTTDNGQTFVALSGAEFNAKTDAELAAYKPFGSRTWINVYDDVHIPTLDEFFRLCALTGTRPFLSVHPVPTLAQWATIKSLAEQYSLTKYLSIKSSYQQALIDAYATFGNTIEKYALYNIYIDDEDGGASHLVNKVHTIFGDADVKIGIEGYYSQYGIDGRVEFKDFASIIRESGYYVCADSVGLENCQQAILDGAEELTTGYNCSSGLNWL